MEVIFISIGNFFIFSVEYRFIDIFSITINMETNFIKKQILLLYIDQNKPVIPKRTERWI